MMWFRRVLWAAFAALPLFATGCIVSLDFDPIGTDATMAGAWTLNDAAPTAESCSALGISNVRVRFFDGLRFSDHPDLVFPCADGSFDTRPNAVLADGLWSIRMLAIDPSGTIVAQGPLSSYDTAVEGGHVVLNPVDFVAAPAVTSLEGSWTLGGAAPTAASCTDLGITSMELEFLEAGVVQAGQTQSFACTDGNFSLELTPGSYEVRLAALIGTEIVPAPAESFTLVEGDTHRLNGGVAIDFGVAAFDPTGTDAALSVIWDIGGNIGTDKVCGAVLGDHVDLVLFSVEDTEFANGFPLHLDAACGLGAYESAANVLAGGSYVVQAQLRAADDSVISSTAHTAVTVVAGTALSLDLDFRLDNATIEVPVTWENGAGGAQVSCAEAGVSTMTWGVYDGPEVSATLIGGSPDVQVDCFGSITLMGGPAGAALAAGTYEIELTGYNASGVKNWDAMCSVTLDGPGGLAFTECQAAFSP